LLRDDAYRERYQQARAKCLEALAVKFLERLLPGATVGRNLFYPTPDGSLAETDALLLFDRYLFIIEAKAGGMRPSARRGAPLALKEAFGRIIEEAFVQSGRVREYILSRGEAIFTDKSGEPAFVVKKSEIDEVFFVNPTLP